MRRVSIGWMLGVASAASAADTNSDGCDDAVFLANGACVHPTATLGSGTTIGAGARVGAGAAVGPDVAIGANAVLAPRTTLTGNIGGGPGQSVGSGSVIGRRTSIGGDGAIGPSNTFGADVTAGSHLVAEDTVAVGYGSTLGAHVTLGSGSSVGNLVQIGDWAVLGANATVGRETTVGSGTAAGPGPGLGAVIDGDVGANATIGAGASVAFGARVGSDARVFDAASVGPFARIGRDATIGAGASVLATATVRADATVIPGARVPAGVVVARGDTWTAGVNTPPNPGTWAVNPASPAAGQTALTCAATVAPSDSDVGDVLSATIAWTVNGAPYTGATSTASSTSDTVPAASTSAGQIWSCRATVFDGRGTAESNASANVTVVAPNIVGQTFTVTVGGLPMVFRGVPSTAGQPGGYFEMGCKGGRDTAGGLNCNDQYTGLDVHNVTLTRQLWVARSEVTQQQFSALSPSNHNPSQHPAVGASGPVDNVSWIDAAWYANRVTAAHNTQYGTALTNCYTCAGTYHPADGAAAGCSAVSPIYSCSGYRLPTEAEWEWAARGGQGFSHPGTNTPGNVAWMSGNAGNTSHPVMEWPANAYGLYDMAGNVVEWAHDKMVIPYSNAAVTDPVGPGAPNTRVLRGGYYNNDAAHTRCAVRDGAEPWFRQGHFGFRLVRTP